ncbi:MAG: NUDIX domain-containing protein [Actinomycetota bacterium]
MAGPRDELLDAFGPTGQFLGPIERDEVHRRGLWHNVFHCLAVRSTPPATVFLQRRHRAARSFAGLLDLTATGHLASGETPVDGVRELREEVGLTADPGQLIPLGRRLVADAAGEGSNCEFVHVFLLPTDASLTDFNLDCCDADGVVEVALSDLLVVLGDSAYLAPCRELDRDGAVHAGTLTAADLVPAVDGYWTVLAVMAQRFATGRRPLAI